MSQINSDISNITHPPPPMVGPMSDLKGAEVDTEKHNMIRKPSITVKKMHTRSTEAKIAYSQLPMEGSLKYAKMMRSFPVAALEALTDRGLAAKRQRGK